MTGRGAAGVLFLPAAHAFRHDNDSHAVLTARSQRSDPRKCRTESLVPSNTLKVVAEQLRVQVSCLARHINSGLRPAVHSLFSSLR